MQSIANIIAKFGANIGIDGLETENGVCTLQFDEVTVTLECGENDDTLYLYSRVCGLPEGDADKLALYGLLLELDSFFKGTDGGVLGIEPLLDAVTYTRRLPLEHLDETVLDRQIGRHVDSVESLRASVTQLREQAAAPGTAAEAGWNDGMLKI
ncbi:CesT family type III secretion system chaperone [uncultured Desulfovibrio sp.]|uniref:CesT family type III secretion system chaperone n=1 Tax=uncultured Desulfovibrio sp. TaxID=167968 RepID=UPI002606DA5C|nr:CesT family type III secretion system chaperone [uncultured Desulfovibrio sp.]